MEWSGTYHIDRWGCLLAGEQSACRNAFNVTVLPCGSRTARLPLCDSSHLGAGSDRTRLREQGNSFRVRHTLGAFSVLWGIGSNIIFISYRSDRSVSSPVRLVDGVEDCLVRPSAGTFGQGKAHATRVSTLELIRKVWCMVRFGSEMLITRSRTTRL